MKVFLVGEGPNELGGLAAHASYQRPGNPGVIEALLRRIQPDGWAIGGGTPWKSIRKFSARTRMSAEARNVLGAAQDAIDRGCDVLVLLRDRDADGQRSADVTTGLAGARELFPHLGVAGGVAIEKLEAWILALRGEHRTESMKHPETALAKAGLPPKDTAALVRVVEAADLDRLPADAHSLRDWIHQARVALGPAT